MPTSHFGEPLAQRIGPYEVLLDIGSGGMGTISLARATGEPVGASGFARLVAIKRPHGALASEPEVLHRFLDEARLLAQVHHANVVGIHQIGADPGGHFLVLDYIEGGSLDELIMRSILHRKKLPPPIVLRIASDMLAGLHAVHEAADVEGKPLRMLHRDVSAQNVLVGRDGVARLVDFGIAKAIISSTVTDRTYLQGRVPYMPPEYLRREEVDRRLDVYAAGVMLWTALAGKLPWQDASEAQIVHHAVHQGIPALSSAGVTVAPAIQEIVTRACDREATQRYATARDMLGAIDELGRRTGWIASHAEVASIVEELLGAELRGRRAAIAHRLSSPDSSPSPASNKPGSTSVASAPVVVVAAPASGPADAAGAAASTMKSAALVLPPAMPEPPTVLIVPSGDRPVVFSEASPALAPSVGSRPSTHAPLALPAAVVERPSFASRAQRGTVLGVGLLVAVSVVAITWTLNNPVGPPSAVGETPSSTERPVAATPVLGLATAEVPAADPVSPMSARLPLSSPAPSSTVAPPPTGSAASSASTAAPPATVSGPVRPVVAPRPSAIPTTLPTGISTSNPYRN